MKRAFAATMILAVAMVLSPMAGAPARGQGVPKNPLTQPKPVESCDKLKLSFLTTVARGTRVTLLMMSGVRITGKVVNVKEEHDVIILEVQEEGGRLGHGYYKSSALAGVEVTAR